MEQKKQGGMSASPASRAARLAQAAGRETEENVSASLAAYLNHCSDLLTGTRGEAGGEAVPRLELSERERVSRQSRRLRRKNSSFDRQLFSHFPLLSFLFFSEAFFALLAERKRARRALLRAGGAEGCHAPTSLINNGATAPAAGGGRRLSRPARGPDAQLEAADRRAHRERRGAGGDPARRRAGRGRRRREGRDGERRWRSGNKERKAREKRGIKKAFAGIGSFVSPSTSQTHPPKKQCSPPHRLYALYLLDSLVKNVGEPYGSLFAQGARLPRALAPAWAVHPQSRPALKRLVATWDGCLPAGELAEARGWIAEQEEQARRGAGFGGGGTAPPAVGGGAPLYSAPGAAAVPPPQYQQPQQMQMLPPHGYQQQEQQQYQQQYYHQQQQPAYAPPQHYQQQQPAPPQPPPFLPPNLPNLLSSLAASGLIRPPSAAANAAARASSSPSPRAGEDGEQQQGGQQRPPKRTRRGGGGGSRGAGGGGDGDLSPFRAAPSPWNNPAAEAPSQNHPQGATAAADAGYYGPPGSDPYRPGAQLGPPPVLPPQAPPPVLSLPLRQRCDLSTRRLRGPHLASLAALEAASSASRPALLEAAAVRRRMAEARAEAGSVGIGGGSGGGGGSAAALGHSRAWFVPPEAWIAGTAAVASSGGPSFVFEGDGAGRKGGKGGKGKKGARARKNASSSAAAAAAAPLPTAPADEAQRSCALTGEPFDSFFDDAAGEWRYRDCLALDAAGAAAMGLPARRCLVKASALLVSGGDDDDDDASEGEGDAGDGGGEGKDAGKENGGGDADANLDRRPSSVPLEQVEAALAEAVAAVGEAAGGGDEEEEAAPTTRVKEEAAA